MSYLALSDKDGVDDARCCCLWLTASDSLPIESNVERPLDDSSPDPSHDVVPLSSHASGFSAGPEPASSVSKFSSMFLRFHMLYQIRHPMPIAKNATYPEALRMIAVTKSFIAFSGRRSRTASSACRFSVLLELDGCRGKLDVCSRYDVDCAVDDIDGPDERQEITIAS